jgi:hypothetical protein
MGLFYTENKHKHEHNTKVTVTHGDQNVNVTEKRAPTDESVRLLREMEASAKKEVEKAFNIHDNKLNCLVQFAQNMIDDTMKVRVTYDLNKARYTTDVALPMWDILMNPLVDNCQFIIDEVAKDMAKNIVAPALGELFSQMMVIKHDHTK